MWNLSVEAGHDAFEVYLMKIVLSLGKKNLKIA
jgi:hypothetical protein